MLHRLLNEQFLLASIFVVALHPLGAEVAGGVGDKADDGGGDGQEQRVLENAGPGFGLLDAQLTLLELDLTLPEVGLFLPLPPLEFVRGRLRGRVAFAFSTHARLLLRIAVDSDIQGSA